MLVNKKKQRERDKNGEDIEISQAHTVKYWPLYN